MAYFIGIVVGLGVGEYPAYVAEVGAVKEVGGVLLEPKAYRAHTLSADIRVEIAVPVDEYAICTCSATL